MSGSPTTPPTKKTWWQTFFGPIEVWSLAHWTYIATFVAGQVIMALWHI